MDPDGNSGEATRQIELAKEVEALRERFVRKRTMRTMLSLFALAAVGLVGCIVYAAQFEPAKFASVLATCFLLASASFAVGALLGFLFAIPRGRRSDLPVSEVSLSQLAADSGPGSGMQAGPAVRANTNLEDISDWLTKILVGVGLTQLGTIGHGLSTLAESLEPPLGGASGSAAFGLSVVVMFGTTGFLVGYLWTRLGLPIAFQRAETEVEEELRRRLAHAEAEAKEERERIAAEVLVTLDKPEVEGSVVQEVADKLSTVAPESAEEFLHERAADYASVRASGPYSPERTRAMARVVAEVRAAADLERAQPATLRTIFNQSEAGRVVALAWVGAAPNPELKDIVLEGIRDFKSDFELYQALRTAEAVVPTLSEDDAKALGDVVREEIGRPGGHIDRASDRWPLAQRVLGLVEEMESPGSSANEQDHGGA